MCVCVCVYVCVCVCVRVCVCCMQFVNKFSRDLRVLWTSMWICELDTQHSKTLEQSGGRKAYTGTYGWLVSHEVCVN